MADYPIIYDVFGVAYDFPEQIPLFVKEYVRENAKILKTSSKKNNKT